MEEREKKRKTSRKRLPIRKMKQRINKKILVKW